MCRPGATAAREPQTKQASAAVGSLVTDAYCAGFGSSTDEDEQKSLQLGPTKQDKFNDEAVSDQGKNFGRVARARIMDDFIVALMEEPLAGIPARYWQSFLNIFAEGIAGAQVDQRLARLRAIAEKAGLTATAPNAFDKIEDALRELFER